MIGLCSFLDDFSSDKTSSGISFDIDGYLEIEAISANA